MRSGGLIFASSLSSEAAFLMDGPLYTCTNIAPMIDVKVPITLTRMLELLQSSFVVLGFTLLLLSLLELQPYSTCPNFIWQSKYIYDGRFGLDSIQSTQSQVDIYN